MIDLLLESLAAGRNLTFEEMRAVTNFIMQGGASDEQIARLLTSLATKGETVDEVAGAAAAMREQMTPIRTTRTGVARHLRHRRRRVRDVQYQHRGGPGGGGGRRAGGQAWQPGGHQSQRLGRRAGRPGSERRRRCADGRGVSRRVGDLLLLCSAAASGNETGGADSPPAGISHDLQSAGTAGQPGRCGFQLLGVGKPRLRPLLAAALARLGVQRAVVVCGDDGLGEVTISGSTAVTEVVDRSLAELRWTPEDFGLRPAPLEKLRVAGPVESAAMIRQVLAGAGQARHAMSWF